MDTGTNVGLYKAGLKGRGAVSRKGDILVGDCPYCDGKRRTTCEWEETDVPGHQP